MLRIYCKDPNCRPERQHSTDAGIDLRADKFYELYSNTPQKIHTGVHIEIPHGYVGLVLPRSSLGLKGITLANTVGVIDADYRGEIICAMVAKKQEQIAQYERIAQLVVVPCINDLNSGKIKFVSNLDRLTKTKRGEGGFGSTGKH